MSTPRPCTGQWTGRASSSAPSPSARSRLFGVLSEREDRVEAPAPTALFFNVGRISHQGPARVWLDLARACVADGVRCLRFDLSGLGDSPTRPGRTEGVEFPADGLEDVAQIRREITAAFGPQILVVGLCSGGHYALRVRPGRPRAVRVRRQPRHLDIPMGRPTGAAVRAERRGGDPIDSGSAHPLIIEDDGEAGAAAGRGTQVARRMVGAQAVLRKGEPSPDLRALDAVGRPGSGRGRRDRGPSTPRGAAAPVPLVDPAGFLQPGGLSRPGAFPSRAKRARNSSSGSCTNIRCAVSPAGPRPHPDRSAGVLSLSALTAARYSAPKIRLRAASTAIMRFLARRPVHRAAHARVAWRERGRPFAAPWPRSSEETPGLHSSGWEPAVRRRRPIRAGGLQSWAPHLP